MMEEYQGDGLPSILDAVKRCTEKWAPGPSDPEEIWFRGEDAAYPLLPGLYREDARRLNYDESNLVERFRAYGTPYANMAVTASEWEWYFVAQHHGLPTRLLDWTENLLVATYFATARHIQVNNMDRREYDRRRGQRPRKRIYDDKSPVVWIMDAGTLNAERGGTDSDMVYTVGGKGTERYSTDGIRKRTRANRMPIAVLPPHSNARIVAQQGTFTVHGWDAEPIDGVARRPGSRIRLARIILDRANVAHLWRDLERCGVTRSALFPGLDSVAFVTKWFSQYPGSASAAPGRKEDHMARRKGGPKKRVKPKKLGR